MKKLLIALALLVSVSAFFAFSNNAFDIDSLTDELTKSEFVSATDSEALVANLDQAFSHLFDQVSVVNIHDSEEHGHYYMVYGTKDSNPFGLAINVTEEMAAKQYFPTMEAFGLAKDSNLNALTCYWQPSGACTTTFALGLRVCGNTVWGFCIPFDLIPL